MSVMILTLYDQKLFKFTRTYRIGSLQQKQLQMPVGCCPRDSNPSLVQWHNLPLQHRLKQRLRITELAKKRSFSCTPGSLRTCRTTVDGLRRRCACIYMCRSRVHGYVFSFWLSYRSNYWQSSWGKGVASFWWPIEQRKSNFRWTHLHRAAPKPLQLP